MTHVENVRTSQLLAAAAPPAAPVGDPAMLGLPTFIAGAVALGLTLTGYVPAASQGAAIPIILLATGIGTMAATGWAMRLAQSAVAAVFGIFSGFWLSYAFLLLGLGHNWYGVAPTDITHTVALFVISWMVVIGTLTLATLALPWAYTLLFSLVELALAFVLAGTLHPSTTLTHLGGYAVFAFAAVGLYMFFGAAQTATGGSALPLGRPVIKH